MALCLAPLLFFAGFVATTIAVSLISAILFSLFWIGIALLFLVPTLFVTFTIALLLWAWAAASFFASRWVYQRLPFSVDGDGQLIMTNSTGNKQVIFQGKKGDDGGSFDVKAEAAEVKD